MINQMDKLNTVNHKNFLDNTLPDKCAKLIIADPPYFEVKGDFDFIWKSFDDYLKDVEKWAIECKRLLADNGTLFWWGHAKKIAYAQIIFDRYFNLENNIAIEFNRQTKKGVELFRCFAPVSERLLMYSNEFEKNNPLSIYLKAEFEKAKVTNKEISKLFPSINGGLTGCVSNWLNGDNVITESQYLKIREYLNNKYLLKDYQNIYQEYQKSRRQFNNFKKLFDVMNFDQEAHITKNYDHQTCKPETLTRVLIKTCTTPNDLVIVPFAGSGTECAMSILECRNFYGYEIEEKHVNTSNKRVKEILRKPQLF